MDKAPVPQPGPSSLEDTISDDSIIILTDTNSNSSIEVETISSDDSVIMIDEEQVTKLDSSYNTLRDMFPKADPVFLRDAAERCGNNQNALTELITELLETKTYPTYLERQRKMELKRKYKERFNVQEFLEIFPNPQQYFEGRNNKGEIDYDIIYLMSRYRTIKLGTIKAHYRRAGHNLTRACCTLDKCINNRKRVRQDTEIKYPEGMNISFMQEVAFIENKALITRFLQEKHLKRKAAYEEAKEKGEFFTCSCCYEEEFLNEDMVMCEEGHLFCKQCVQKYVETCIGDGKTTFTCLTTCDAELSLQTLKGVLKASAFSRLLKKRQFEEVNAAHIPGLENCPFCEFAMIPAEDDKVFRCLNDECMKHSCRNCKREDHIPLRCWETGLDDETQVRTYIEDKMTEALIRECWNCKKTFVKESGCNRMQCVCGAKMCYICKQAVEDYSHFNGQDGIELNKCPLFSNNEESDTTKIIQEGLKAKALALSSKPHVQLKNDPTEAFSKPSTSKGTEHVRDNPAWIHRKRRHDDA